MGPRSPAAGVRRRRSVVRSVPLPLQAPRKAPVPWTHHEFGFSPPVARAGADRLVGPAGREDALRRDLEAGRQPGDGRRRVPRERDPRAAAAGDPGPALHRRGELGPLRPVHERMDRGARSDRRHRELLLGPQGMGHLAFDLAERRSCRQHADAARTRRSRALRRHSPGPEIPDRRLLLLLQRGDRPRDRGKSGVPHHGMRGLQPLQRDPRRFRPFPQSQGRV